MLYLEDAAACYWKGRGSSWIGLNEEGINQHLQWYSLDAKNTDRERKSKEYYHGNNFEPIIFSIYVLTSFLNI